MKIPVCLNHDRTVGFLEIYDETLSLLYSYTKNGLKINLALSGQEGKPNLAILYIDPCVQEIISEKEISFKINCPISIEKDTDTILNLDI